MSRVSLLLVEIRELVTLAPGNTVKRGARQSELGIIENGAVAIDDRGVIRWVGPTPQAPIDEARADGARIISCEGRSVIPGFVDPHTHTVFAGDRIDEFEQILAGAEYVELLARGGGIHKTVALTRSCPTESLVSAATSRLARMLAAGTTTVEIKTGYGLDPKEEMRLVDVIGQVRQRTPVEVVGTLLAGHAVPLEWRDRRNEFLDAICAELIPSAAQTGIVEYCDVFCEGGAFSPEESRRILESGLRHGLRSKIHAEQKSHSGGALVAADLRACSADHLEYAEEEDLRALARAGTIAVLLPGAALFTREERRPLTRRMVELGVPIALGTDFNPGSSPIWSMSTIIGLACLLFHLTPAEALVAATVNAACALGRHQRVGSIEPGKQGDLIILGVPSYRYIPYYFGASLVETVMKRGQIVVEEGKALP